jgi:hypothetical protein
VRAAPRGEQTHLDDRAATDVRIPRARKTYHCTAALTERRKCQVLDCFLAGADRLSLRKQVAAHQLDCRRSLQPQRQIDQVNAQIEQAAATGESPLVAPRLVGTVRVVEGELHSEDVAELASRDAPTQLVHATHVPIAIVDAEQAIGRLSSRDDSLRLSSADRERLLAEHRYATLQTFQCLLRMTAVRCGDDDSVDIALQQLRNVASSNRAGEPFDRGTHALRIDVGKHRHLDFRKLRCSIESLAADPAQPEKTQAQRARCCRGQLRLRAHEVPRASAPS